MSYTSWAQIQHREVSIQSGLNHKLLKWEQGCGVSFSDFNNDGLDDITLGTEYGRPISFYENSAEGFKMIPAVVDNVENVRQVLWIDFDNDGDKDLYVSAYEGISKLYRNDGNLVLTDITEAVQLPLQRQRSIGATWGDVNRDGWLDLYCSTRRYLENGIEDNYNRLFLNIGGEYFEEVPGNFGTEDRGRLPFCAAFLDINNDLWPDIYIANDKFNRNSLLLNKAGKSYEDISEISEAGILMNAMCVTPWDINNDEKIDIYLTNIYDLSDDGILGNKLLVNQSTIDQSQFAFSEEASLYNLTYKGTGWNSTFYDGDNDGDGDLFVSGTVSVGPTFASHFYEKTGSQFEPTIYSELINKNSFSAAKGDIDNNGLLDILVQINTPDPYQLWVNEEASTNNFVKLKLEGVVSNKEGIGAHIRLFSTTGMQYQQVYSNTGFLSQDSDKVHFGVGQDELIDSIQITWPTGHIDTHREVIVNQLHRIKEGSEYDSIYIDPSLEISSMVTTASEEESSPNLISISPNPTQDVLMMSTEKTINQLEIFDISSKLIEKWLLPGDEISIGHLRNGLYILRIEIEGQLYVVKIVKQ